MLGTVLKSFTLIKTTNIDKHIQLHTNTYAHMGTQACEYIFTNSYMHIYTCTHTHMHTTVHTHISSSWRSIASDEDVSESYGVSAAQSWTRKCDHTGGMQQQPLGQVFFLCGPGAYDRDPANVSF